MLAAANDAMTRYAAGQDSAFAELYDAVSPRLYSYLLKRTKDTERAADLVQQSLLRVHRARASFIPGAPVLPWVLGIARRLVIDEARSAAREAAGLYKLMSAVAPESVLADELAEASEVVGQIEREIARLPRRQRDAFNLVKRQRLSLGEAAESLNITTNALKVRLHRAYRTLLAALAASR